MPWIFLGAILVVLLLLLVNWAARADAASVRRVARYVGAFLLAVGAIFFLTRGLLGPAGVLALASAAVASRKLLPFLGGSSKSAAQQSQVETAYLRVSLDHDTGDVAGEVLAGRYAGRRLDEMSRDELAALQDDLRTADPDGARLLDAYLARMFGGEWREEQAQRPSGAASSGGPMSRDEAFEVLGLKPGATMTEIKAAHHRLMKKFHPDQGGSTYFASRINEAKDLLLKS
ncbi:MAG: DnaJ domain-containing protein [Alphaproteobacteria bacterium]|nr:DnaJ domain-containing protein [Alphaproteobacteria bacterium]